jgi:hypothetical protein
MAPVWRYCCHLGGPVATLHCAEDFEDRPLNPTPNRAAPGNRTTYFVQTGSLSVSMGAIKGDRSPAGSWGSAAAVMALNLHLWFCGGVSTVRSPGPPPQVGVVRD